ncbi:hypothetical protein EV702DRAFT_1090099, partial [Suillus placidus]
MCTLFSLAGRARGVTARPITLGTRAILWQSIREVRQETVTQSGSKRSKPYPSPRTLESLGSSIRTTNKDMVSIERI